MRTTPREDDKDIDKSSDSERSWHPGIDFDEHCDYLMKRIIEKRRWDALERQFEGQAAQIEASALPNERKICFVVNSYMREPHLLVQNALPLSADNSTASRHLHSRTTEARRETSVRAHTSEAASNLNFSQRRGEEDHETQRSFSGTADAKEQGKTKLRALQIPTEPRADRERRRHVGKVDGLLWQFASVDSLISCSRKALRALEYPAQDDADFLASQQIDRRASERSTQSPRGREGLAIVCFNMLCIFILDRTTSFKPPRVWQGRHCVVSTILLKLKVSVSLSCEHTNIVLVLDHRRSLHARYFAPMYLDVNETIHSHYCVKCKRS